MNNWSDIQIAYLVAKHGSLTKASEELGVHHSTVLRHVDAIEARLACKLFHRHTRGYTPTDAGWILFREAEATQERLERMIGKLNGQDEQLSGPFVITSVSTLSAVIMPVIDVFIKKYPSVDLIFQADSRIFKLEHGEAHVSIRPGAKPKDLDYVVQKLVATENTLFANESYIAKYGSLASLSDIDGHKFLNLNTELNNIQSVRWLNETVPTGQISFRGSDFNILIDAALNGIGIVPLDCLVAEKYPGLTRVLESPADWRSNIWLVTHRDVHFSPKVRAFNEVLKEVLGDSR
jgi:DNA-binding transcriptional LysR family regulator